MRQASRHWPDSNSLGPALIGYARTPEIVRRGQERYDVGVYRLGRFATRVDLHGQWLRVQERFHLAFPFVHLVVVEVVFLVIEWPRFSGKQCGHAG